MVHPIAVDNAKTSVDVEVPTLLNISFWEFAKQAQAKRHCYIYRAPLANLGLWDHRGKFWDNGITPCLKLGLQKSALELELWISNPAKFGFFHPCKLGLLDFTLFEIGVMGLRLFWNWDYRITGPPLWGPYLYLCPSEPTASEIVFSPWSLGGICWNISM